MSTMKKKKEAERGNKAGVLTIPEVYKSKGSGQKKQK